MIILKTLAAFAGDLLSVLFVALTVLLVAALFNLKAFRKGRERTFFLLALAVIFGWRFVFCFYNGGGISDRYIAVLPLLAAVLAAPGIPILVRWLVKLARSRGWQVRPAMVTGLLLAIIVAISLGKALNPPDRKPYVQATAQLLQSAPVTSLLIDSTADGGRALYAGGLDAKIRLITVAKYYKSPAAFWDGFLPAYRKSQETSIPTYLLLRVKENDDRVFLSEWQDKVGSAMPVRIYSGKIKKATIFLYKMP